MVWICVRRLVFEGLFVIYIPCMWFNWFKIHLMCFVDLVTLLTCFYLKKLNLSTQI